MTAIDFPLARRRAASTTADHGISAHRVVRWLWISPILLGLAATLVYPTLFLVALALSKSTLGKPFRSFVGLQHVREVFQDPLFVTSVTKSIAYAFVTASIQLVIGFLIALLFTRLLKAGRFLVSLILLPLMTPPVMVGVAWKLILAPAGGLLNGVLLNLGIVDAPVSFLGDPVFAWFAIAVADIWQWTPFVVILSFAALSTIPEGVHEASIIDGASPLQRFWHITLPLVAAPLSSIYLLKLILSFKVFDLVYVLTFGGPGFATTTTGFSIYRRALEQFDVARAAAETLIYSLVIGAVLWPVIRLHQHLERKDA
ncbi:carbohydrate ABC transporter permease [Rhizobium mulingense]|uniref:carbohydrate ABC transporter permease n=1 Tax=Rhizobium mulingense TaxID=3031128 RepID=UPI002B4A657F|nr:sugar ABC transporter permease [Rhizobium sp. MJ21]MEB3046698.1 sugar ABC transporter permease [Rhizobium sp. MJ21]